MSIFNRHPWSKKFSDWLTTQKFNARSYNFQRACGKSELLEMGNFEDQDRQTIIFLHGLGNDLFFPNINFFRILLTQGFNVVTCDLDGHGQNLTSIFSDDHIDTLVGDMISNSVLVQASNRNVHVCGFSLGAVLALDYATRHAEKIKTISLIGMPLILKADTRIITELMSPFLGSFQSAVKDYGLSGIRPAIGPLLRNRYPVRLAQSETASYLDVAGRIIRRLDPPTKLLQTNRPTLYMGGQYDFIANNRSSAKFLDELRESAFLKRVILPSETHFSLMLTAKTPRFIADLLRSTR